MDFTSVFFFFYQQKGDKETAQYKKEIHAQVTILEQQRKDLEKSRHRQIIGHIAFCYRLVDMKQENHEKTHEAQTVEIGKEYARFGSLVRNRQGLSTCKSACGITCAKGGRVVFCHAGKNSINAKYTGLLFHAPVVSNQVRIRAIANISHPIYFCSYPIQFYDNYFATSDICIQIS
jgi:hypothetical protein